jgi:ankyrin repeat protein
MLRWFFGVVCSRGTPEQAREFINVGLKITDLSTNFDTSDCICFDDGSLSADPMPRAAQPLYHAASAGNATMLSWLLEHEADPNMPASDGTTPFYAACAEGHMDILHILREHGADTATVDQDGTSPALIAAAGGRLDVVKALHEFGVDLQAPGHIYDYEGDFKLLRNMTPLMVAQYWGQIEVAAYLQSVQLKPEKRVRSDDSMLERAARAGVADRLKPIPASLLAATRVGSGTLEQIQAAKKQLKSLQTANQQIVSRAEKAKLKQTKLV